MNVLQILFVAGALALFLWMVIPEPGKKLGGLAQRGRRLGAGRRRRPAKASGGNRDQSLQVGGGTGLLGGDIEDAAIGRYAMGRTPKDPNSSDERDLGNALGMQNFTDFGG